MIHGGKDCTLGPDKCNRCKRQIVEVGNGRIVKIEKLEHCPFAFDFTQEEFILQAFRDRERGGLGVVGNMAGWLVEGFDAVDEYQAEKAKKERAK